MDESRRSDYEGLQVVPNSDGLNVTVCDQELKEAVQCPTTAYVPTRYNGMARIVSIDSQACSTQDSELGSSIRKQPSTTSLQQRRKKKIWVFTAMALLLLGIIVTVVPATVLVTQQTRSADDKLAAEAREKHKGSIESTAEAETSDNHATTNQAFNSSGLACIAPHSGQDNLWLFWQTRDGDIRQSRFDETSKWLASERIGIENAANGTALAALTHVHAEFKQAIHHIVYVTDNNFLADVYSVNEVRKWQDGGLYDLRLAVPDYPSKTLPSRLTFLAKPGSTKSSLYAPGSKGNLNEITYDHKERLWVREHIFEDTNGFSGVAPQTYANSRITSFSLQGKDGKLRQFWRDQAASKKWHIGAEVTANIYPDSSITAPVEGADANMVYYLSDSSEITARQISGIAAEAKWGPETALGIHAVPGSQLFAVAAERPDENIAETHMFFQNEGDDIQHYVGSGTKFEKRAPVPVKT